MRCCGVVFALCWAQWISYPLQCCSNSWQVVQTLPGRGLQNEKWGRVFLGPAGVGYDKIDNLRGEFPGGIREVIDGGNRSVPNQGWVVVEMLPVPGFGCANKPEARLVSKRLCDSAVRSTYEPPVGKNLPK